MKPQDITTPINPEAGQALIDYLLEKNDEGNYANQVISMCLGLTLEYVYRLRKNKNATPPSGQRGIMSQKCKDWAELDRWDPYVDKVKHRDYPKDKILNDEGHVIGWTKMDINFTYAGILFANIYSTQLKPIAGTDRKKEVTTKRLITREEVCELIKGQIQEYVNKTKAAA